MVPAATTPAPGERQLLTPAQLARELQVSVDWIRDHASGRRKPKLPCVRLGDRRGTLRFRRSDIDRFLAANARNQQEV
jgi:hypothetical protein